MTRVFAPLPGRRRQHYFDTWPPIPGVTPSTPTGSAAVGSTDGAATPEAAPSQSPPEAAVDAAPGETAAVSQAGGGARKRRVASLNHGVWRIGRSV